SLKECNFILTVQTGTKNRILLPEYHCKSEQFETTKNNPTNAISTIYALIFNTKMRYSCYQVMGWTDDKWEYARTGFQSLINFTFQRRQAIFVSQIEDDKYILEIYQNSKLLKQFV
ncbi:40603_t:CDS:2, partial [Gigaspora margarita]